MLQLRNFGMGKNSLQGPILKEVSEIVDYLTKLDGKPSTAIKGLLTHHLSNVICSFAFGHRSLTDLSCPGFCVVLMCPFRFEQDDKEFRHIVGMIEECFKIGTLHFAIA